MTDKDGGFDTKTFQVSVSPALDAVNDSATVIANSANNPINVLRQRHAVERDDHRSPKPDRHAVGPPQSARPASAAGRGISYTPPVDYVGGDTFTYTITDGAGHFDTATVTMTVQGSGTMDSRMFLEDAELHDLDGSFDVLFGKSPRPYDTSYVRLKSTSPGHIHLRAEINNNTNVNFDSTHYEPRVDDHHRAGHAGELRPRGRRLLQCRGSRPSPRPRRLRWRRIAGWTG